MISPNPNASNDQKPSTRAEWAAQRLRGAILTGELAPGERLVLANLATDLSISPTPLREALQTLAAEGLVEIEAQKGARVTSVSIDDLEDLYRMRISLEPSTLQMSVENSDEAYRESIRAAFQPLADAFRIDPTTAESAHRDFHLALVANCGSKWRLRLTEILIDNASRYRLLSTQVRGGPEAIIKEHEGLMKACLDGDAKKAADLLTAHLNLTLTLAAKYIAHPKG